MTAAELVERVRDALNDYGDVELSAAASLTADVAAADSSIFVDTADVFDVGDWLHCGWEVMEVTEVSSSPANTVYVRRGMRGTTATTHTTGDVVRSGLRFSGVTILNTLNASLAGAYPLLYKVVEDITNDVDSSVREYTLAAPVRSIRSIWIEDGVGEGTYSLCRIAVPLNDEKFVLYGAWTDGLNIKVIGTDVFDRMTTTGSLDTDFPDNDEAYEYLVKDATGRLLATLAAAEAVNNAVESRGAVQGQDTRYVLINASKQLRADAKAALVKARMQLPPRITPRPDARYF